MMRRLDTLALVTILAACGGKTEDLDSNGSGGSGASASGGSPTGGSSGMGAGGSAGAGATGGIGPISGCFNTSVSGSLPAPAEPGAVLRGPSVTATDTGFAIGYTEWGSSTARAVLHGLSDQGFLDSEIEVELESCVSAPSPSSGVGMAWNGSGLFVAPTPRCSANGAGLLFWQFTDDVSGGKSANPQNGLAASLDLARSASVAPASAANEFEVVYRIVRTNQGGGDSDVERVIIQNVDFKPAVLITQPFGPDDRPLGMVASAKTYRAFGAPDLQNQLTEIKLGTSYFDSFEEQMSVGLTQAPYLALAASPGEVTAAVLVSVGNGVVNAEVARATLVNDEPTMVTHGTVGGSMEGPVPSSAELDSSLLLGNLEGRVILLHGMLGKVTVFRFSESNPLAPETSTTTSEIAGTSLANFDGAHVAMAVARDRIVIAWLNDPENAQGPAGGWAMLGCAD